MKIPASIRHLYEDQLPRNQLLKSSVDDLILGIKEPRWHYESRVKQLQSFALKVESGRFSNPGSLEDFFACTLVVANFSEVAEAEKRVREHLRVEERRPEQSDKTHKLPSDFPFDDLRLYARLPEDPARPPSELTPVLFEVQIKTFLQHAWAIATHDLVYKVDDVNWSMQRIAYQTKAMLEHAEVSIQEAGNLASSSTLAKQDDQTSQMKHAIALLKRHWNADELPTDLRRLAQNIQSLLRAANLDLGRLDEVLNSGRANGGAHPANLSPFATIIQYLLQAEPRALTYLLARNYTGTRKASFRVLIPAEVAIPPALDQKGWKNAIFLR